MRGRDRGGDEINPAQGNQTPAKVERMSEHSENEFSKETAGATEGIPGSAEPTVLDWFVSLLRLQPIPIPDDEAVYEPSPYEVEATPPDLIATPIPIVETTTASLFSLRRYRLAHFRFPIALISALTVQFLLERREGELWLTVGLFVLAAVMIGWSFWAGDFRLPAPIEGLTAGGTRPDRGSTGSEAVDEPNEHGQAHQAKGSSKTSDRHDVPPWLREPRRTTYLVSGVAFSLLTFLASGGNEFSLIILLFWIAALVFLVMALWEGEPPFASVPRRLMAVIRSRELSLHWNGWTILLVASLALVAFFRFSRLADVPYEMWSDHAEKLLDVMDVLNGQTRIFFPRNTGREPLQFYMAAATAKWLGTGISFLTLKIGTALAGLLTLPYVYLFAKEYAGREVGLAAFLLAGVAYWPNVISRIGLRFPLYPLFVAPAFYYLLRGLRLKRRNDFLLCGLAIGLGLNGYSPARVIPFAVALGLALYLIHGQSRGQRRQAIAWLGAAAVVAFVVFIPLFRVAMDMPDLFMSRTLTRIGTEEQAYPGPPLEILLSNLWNGLRMFNWDDGEIWVVSIPHRPALDWITGGLFAAGGILVVARYIRRRKWQDLFLLLAIPVLMTPSTLSMAFPNENPAPNRASGVMVPVFTIAALPLALIPSWLDSTWGGRGRQTIGFAVSAGLFLFAASMNYHLALEGYGGQIRRDSWNTAEAGSVIRDFAGSIGSYKDAYVVRFANWMDTRLVWIHAGRPGVDSALWWWQLESLPDTDEARLFIFSLLDENAFDELRTLYPEGSLKRWSSAIEGRDFYIYLVPPRKGDPYSSPSVETTEPEDAVIEP